MRYRRNTSVEIALIALSAPAAAMAGDLLNHVPANCAAVFVIRDPKATDERIDALLASITRQKPDPGGGKVSAAMGRFGLLPGVWDSRSPVVFIVSNRRDEVVVTVGFRRLDPARFKSLDAMEGGAPAVRELNGDESERGFGVRIGEFVFLSRSRGALERLARLEPTKSFRAGMTAEQADYLNRSDVFVHARTASFRSSIEQYLTLGSALASMATGPDSDADAERAMVSWLVSGARSCIQQLRWTDVAVRFDGDGITLTHIHQFAPDGSVARYFADARRSPGDIWTGLHDMPFLFALATNWQHNGEDSVVTSMLAHLYSIPCVKDKIPPAKWKQLKELVAEWYVDLRMSNCIISATPGRGLPMELRGVYTVENADRAIEKFLKLQACNMETAGAFLPGSGFEGHAERIELNGATVYQVVVDFKNATPDSQAMMKNMYGPTPRFQAARLSPTQFGYAVSSSPGAISRMLESNAKRPAFSSNPSVRHIMSRLSPKPNVVVIVDVGQILALAPRMAAQLTGDANEGAALGQLTVTPPSPSPLAAWSLTVGPQSVRGDLYMSQRDIQSVAGMIQQMANQAAQAHEAPKAAPRKHGGPGPHSRP